MLKVSVLVLMTLIQIGLFHQSVLLTQDLLKFDDVSSAGKHVHSEHDQAFVRCTICWQCLNFTNLHHCKGHLSFIGRQRTEHHAIVLSVLCFKQLSVTLKFSFQSITAFFAPGKSRSHYRICFV